MEFKKRKTIYAWIVEDKDGDTLLFQEKPEQDPNTGYWIGTYEILSLYSDEPFGDLLKDIDCYNKPVKITFTIS